MLLPLLKLNDAVAPPATIAAGSLVGGAPLGGTPLAGSSVRTVAVSGASTVATSQGQSVSATATGTLDSSAATSQGQSVSATAARSIDATASTAQGQSANATTARTIDATGATAQGQTVDATATAGATIDATVATSQAQSTAATTVQTLATVFNGGFDMSRKVYVKRGKHYLIFNNNAEADAYINAEAAIETAKQSSRGAAKRVIKALKLVKPEIVEAPKLEELSSLLAKFNVDYDVIQLEKNNDMAALYQIQSMLYALQQDEDDIELLLLAI